MRNCRLIVLIMIVAGCFSPRVTFHRVVTLTEHSPIERDALRDEIVRREQALQSRRIDVARSVELVSAFVQGRPRRLEPSFVREVLLVQAELDHDLMRYQALGGHLWCERPITESRRHGVSIETLPFVGLPRYRDVARGTECFLEDARYPGGRRPISPLLNLEYRLGIGNDLTGDEYVMERYPIAPLPPVPSPVPLPLVCYGVFCHVVEPQVH